MATQPVKLELGGRERTLKMTLWAVARVGDELGIKVRLGSLEEDLMSQPVPLNTLALLLWSALVHEDENLTVDEVAKWVDQDNANEVIQAFFALFGGRLSETTRQELTEQMGVEVPTPS